MVGVLEDRVNLEVSTGPWVARVIVFLHKSKNDTKVFTKVGAYILYVTCLSQEEFRSDPCSLLKHSSLSTLCVCMWCNDVNKSTVLFTSKINWNSA